jgi:hypothetical protein
MPNSIPPMTDGRNPGTAKSGNPGKSGDGHDDTAAGLNRSGVNIPSAYPFPLLFAGSSGLAVKLIRRRALDVVDDDDFNRTFSGFQSQAKLLLKSVKQRGGIGIGWGWRKPLIWCAPARRLKPVIWGELEFEVIDALKLGFIRNGVA